MNNKETKMESKIADTYSMCENTIDALNELKAEYETDILGKIEKMLGEMAPSDDTSLAPFVSRFSKKIRDLAVAEDMLEEMKTENRKLKSENRKLKVKLETEEEKVSDLTKMVNTFSYNSGQNIAKIENYKKETDAFLTRVINDNSKLMSILWSCDDDGDWDKITMGQNVAKGLTLWKCFDYATDDIDAFNDWLYFDGLVFKDGDELGDKVIVERETSDSDEEWTPNKK